MRRPFRTFLLTLLASTLLVAVTEAGLRHFGEAPTRLAYLDRWRSENPGREISPALTSQQVLLHSDYRGFSGPDGKWIVPLAGLPDTLTQFCREEEGYQNYTSDRWGYPNPDPASLTEPGIALVGDSYAQGQCYPREAQLAGHLERLTGKRVLNLGSFGNGPLANLATIREYLGRRTGAKPGIVLWIHVANDLGVDLPIESESAILSRYLDEPTFSQDLASRSTNDRVRYADSIRRFLAHEELEERSHPHPLERARLEILRRGAVAYQRLIHPFPARRSSPMDYDQPLAADTFHRYDAILAQARKEVEAWGGRLVFVLIPDAQMMDRGEQGRPLALIESYRARVLALARGQGLQTVDLLQMFGPAAFSHSRENLSFFAPLGLEYGHFNRKGYGLASEWIARELSGDILHHPVDLALHSPP